MDPKTNLIGIVIRKDGTVPFDDPHNTQLRDAVLSHLKSHGHEVEEVHGTQHYRIKGWVKGQKVERH